MMRFASSLAFILVACSSTQNVVQTQNDAGTAAPTTCAVGGDPSATCAGNGFTVACPAGVEPPAACVPSSVEGTYCCAQAVDAGSSNSNPNANPYGAIYPTDHIGWTPRSAGRAAGDRIANLSFTGYLPGTSTKSSTLNLSNWYDPERRSADALVIVAGSLWEPHSVKTIEAAQATAKRVAILFVIDQNAVNEPATAKDIAATHTLYPKVSVVSDPAFAKLGPAFPQPATPLVMVIDVRTMEISYSDLGAFESTSSFDTLVQPIIDQNVGY